MEINKAGLEMSLLGNLEKMQTAADLQELEKHYKAAQRDLDRAKELCAKTMEFNALYARFLPQTTQE